MNRQRNTTIDFLRGLATLLMILIHVTAYFLSNPVVYFVWDYTHIVVPLFIFCSAFIYFKRGSYSLGVGSTLKRIKRLIIPYYLYLVLLFGVFFIIDPSFFSINEVIKKFLLFQGRDLNWLVVLFLLFIPLFSFLEYAYQKRPTLLKVVGVVALITSIFLLTNTIGLPFRYIMWLPWCVYLIFTMFYAKQSISKKSIVAMLVVSVLVYIVSRGVLIGAGRSLTLTENKYPPNIFYLSYGIFWTILLYELHAFLDARGVIPRIIQRSFDFMSTYSYSLFFIHFWYVTILRKVIDYQMLGWLGFFAVILALSVITQVVINKIKGLIL